MNSENCWNIIICCCYYSIFPLHLSNILECVSLSFILMIKEGNYLCRQWCNHPVHDIWEFIEHITSFWFQCFFSCLQVTLVATWDCCLGPASSPSQRLQSSSSCFSWTNVSLLNINCHDRHKNYCKCMVH